MRKGARNNNKSQKAHLVGRVINIPSKPADLIPRPWYHATVRISTLAVTVLNFTGLFDHLRSQLGLGTSNNLRLRLQSLRVWGPVNISSSNTSTAQLHIRIYDPITNSVTQEVIRYPDVVNRSSCGYVYSEVVRNTPVGTGANPIVEFLSPATGADVANCVIYAQCLWRFVS